MWKIIPAERARDIERLTGIPLHLLRPDLWLPPWSSTETAQKVITRKKIKKADNSKEAVL